MDTAEYTKNLKYNKKCAAFLGIKKIGSELESIDTKYSWMCTRANTEYLFQKDDFPYLDIWDYLKFDSDWNWIMEIVEKIETLQIKIPEKYKKGFLKNSIFGSIIVNVGYDNREEFKGWTSDVSIEICHPFIYDSSNKEPSRFETKKQAVVEAINAFLIWYETVEKS